MLLFLLKKPTQFDSPFFQYLAANSTLPFTVLYLQAAADSSDIELQHPTNWGIDLYGGYSFRNVDAGSTIVQAAEILQTLGASRLVTNGYKDGFSAFVDAALQLKIPVDLRIDSVMFSKPWLLRPLHKFFMKKRYSLYERLLTTGKKGIEYLQAGGIEKSRIGWWPYCTDNHFFDREKNATAAALLREKHHDVLGGKKVFLAVCKLNNRESPVELLSAFIRLARKDTALIILGDGPLMPALQELKQANPHSAILLPGRVPYIQLPAWYGIADVFVHPAANEPWGVSVQEALAANLALVCSSKVGSAYDLVVHGANGFIYPAGNVKALKLAMENALLLDETNKAQTNKAVMEQWNYGAVMQAVVGDL